MAMNDEQKQQLEVVVAATINGDQTVSKSAFSQYLTMKLADALKTPPTAE